MGLIAKLAVEQTTYFFDMPFDYYIPDFLSDTVQVGCRVLVNFGRGDNNRQAIVLEITNDDDLGDNEKKKIKSILRLLDLQPLLNEEMIMLVKWLSETTFSTLYSCCKLMMPIGVNLKIHRSISLVKAIMTEDIQQKNQQQQDIITYFLHRKSAVDFQTFCDDLQIKSNNKNLQQLISENYFAFSDEAVQKMNDASVKMVRLIEENLENNEISLSPKQKQVVNLLQETGCASVKEICYFLGVTSSVISGVVKKSLAEFYDAEVMRNPYKDVVQEDEPKNITLTQQQTQAFDNLISQYNGKKGTSLLYGVTGSGKTSVFIRLIDYMLDIGKNSILMVPEISLTPQLMQVFHKYFGKKIAIFHSGLSIGERMDEFKRVKRGEVNIVLGTRSAVFAPLTNIGLIIMDEEQEYTYKSEKSPRFHARNVAKFRCGYNKALLLLASATPSVESFYMAKNGVYTLNTMTKRYGNARLPEVEIVDMTTDIDQNSRENFSSKLIDALGENLKNSMQSILLLNRRGFHTFAVCNACKTPVTCPNCSISLTYHSANSRLMCHYCGYSIPVTQECPVCHEKQVRFGGVGTQRAEEELAEIFPNARILRMDTDSTMQKFSYETKLKDFQNGKYDIMIGTQMVAKGLNFPKVTLVGVISADQSLYGNDFRSYEKAFSLLTQVVGRSGRGNDAGKAIIQTNTPQNPIIELAGKQDYDGFYDEEIMIRKAMLYPPFSDICMVGFSGLKNDETKKGATFFLENLKKLMISEYPKLPLRVIGPNEATILRVCGKYRYKIIIKCKNNKEFRQMMKRLIIEYGKNRQYNKVSIYVDINPDNVL